MKSVQVVDCGCRRSRVWKGCRKGEWKAFLWFAEQDVEGIPIRAGFEDEW